MILPQRRFSISLEYEGECECGISMRALVMIWHTRIDLTKYKQVYISNIDIYPKRYPL